MFGCVQGKLAAEDGIERRLRLDRATREELGGFQRLQDKAFLGYPRVHWSTENEHKGN